ncbi:4Fe-4S binding protein [Tsukamurella sp. 8F]|uniref:4Fe-4S binding protein n=1 Tax=unclassified Tsukamurella TaxID=2633480 RepID=UPI0023B8CA1B|nr:MULTISPECIES: 4Fe-4S binding protein [unclassified Tsukamurella]MDF0529853.1 4Fe-4S binding protein [Tsukamurella sp. 8J]MDF0587045.1 4Fe-4S binding protein [Tsukamurella sp. 8F]
MPHVITQACCSDASCVNVCPVNCIHPTPGEPGFGGSEILHIDPDTCIDCGACADACPVDAIYPLDRLGPADLPYAQINADFYTEHPEITSGWDAVEYRPAVRVGSEYQIAIVGTGPSAGYALRELVARTDAHITVIDKLPTPGGLVRAGVAPDHPGTKGVLKGFDLMYRHPRVTVATNIEVGRDVSPAEIDEYFDAVIYGVGASSARKLGIDGEDLPGSTAATDLVAWYNAVPDVPRPFPDLPARSHRAVVVGTGNVALDVARILLSPVERLRTTDIADRALEYLTRQDLHEVVLLGRRAATDAAYTAAEFRALQSVPGLEVVVDEDDGIDVTAPADPSRRRIVLKFHTSPVAAVGDEAVEAVRVDAAGTVRDIPADLLVRSIGYRSVPIDGLPFDEAAGRFPNAAGRITGPDGGVQPGRYVVGWAKRGPSGGIGTNRIDAIATVEALVEDVAAGKLAGGRGTGSEAFVGMARRRVGRVVDYGGLRSIDVAERRRGEVQGRPRVKFERFADMLASTRRSRRT